MHLANLRSLFSVFLSLVVCLLFSVCPALADPPIPTAPILYKDALPALQQSGIPLKLPKVLVYPNAQGAYGATLNYANGNGYSLTIGNRYPCHGTACALGYVEAQRRGVDIPDSIEEMYAEVGSPDFEGTRSTEKRGWGTLANGQQAFFAPWESQMGAAYAYLTWDDGDFRYQISLKFGKLQALMDMANSIFPASE